MKWEELGFQIALELQKHKFWEVYIRKEQLEYIYQALSSKQDWDDFMTFTKEKWLQIKDPSTHSEFPKINTDSSAPTAEPEFETQPHTHKELQREPELGQELISSQFSKKHDQPILETSKRENVKKSDFYRTLAAISARSIVFEQFLSVLYPLDCENCTTDLEIPLNQKIDFESLVKNHIRHTFNPNPNPSPKHETNDKLILEGKVTDLLDPQTASKTEIISSEIILDSSTMAFGNIDTNTTQTSFGLGDLSVAPRKIVEFDDFDDESGSDTSNDSKDSSVTDSKPITSLINEKKQDVDEPNDLNSKWLSSFLGGESAPATDVTVSKGSVFASDQNSTQHQTDVTSSGAFPIAATKKVPIGLDIPLLDSDHSLLSNAGEWQNIKTETELFIQAREESNKNDSIIAQISNLTSLKNLAAFIDKNHDKVEIPSFEIASLLTEVRPKKSKWACDEVPGLEDLYMGLENTLSELRGMGNIVLPFLAQVKRRDAPDYYDVISHPMDFGTMSKRLKNFYYRSKKDFENDIRLIRNNCFQYNTAPNHPYRKQADTILKKAEHLLAKVPDIVVPERHPMELDEEQNTEFGDDSDTGTVSELGFMGSKDRFLNDSDASYSTPKSFARRDGTPLPSSHLEFDKNNLNKTPTDYSLVTDPKYNDPLSKITNIASNDFNETREFEMHEEFQTSIIPQKRSVSQVTLEELQKHSGSLFLDTAYFERETKQYRANNIRESLNRQNLSFADQKALIRTPALMAASIADSHLRFLEIDSDSAMDAELLISKAKALLNQIAEAELTSADSTKEKFTQKRMLDGIAKDLKGILSEMEGYISNSDTKSDSLQITPYQISSGLSDLLTMSTFKPVELEKVQTEMKRRKGGASSSSSPSPSFNSSFYPKNRMLHNIVNSINILQKARIVDNKISTLKFNISVGYYDGNPQDENGLLGSSSMKEDFKLDLSDKNNNYFSTDCLDKYNTPKTTEKPSNLINRESAAFFTRQICSLMLAHAGFEKFTKPTLNLMSEVIIQYISNLGLTLRTYTDKYSKSMSTEAILAHVMCENGIESVEDIKYYCEDKIEKSELKLENTLSKLMLSFKDLISGTVSAQADKFGEFTTDDSFVKGDLAVIGEDFFGFRELGLDKELGLDISKGIPSELWFGKTNNKYNSLNIDAPIQELQYIPPPLWKQVSDLKGQVGVFVPFLSDKLGIPPPEFDFEQSNITMPADHASMLEDPYKVIEEYIKDFETRAVECDPIIEDEFLPPRSKYGNGTRPKVPPPNHLTKKEPQAAKSAAPKTTNKKTSDTPSANVNANTTASTNAITAKKPVEPLTNGKSTPFSWLNGLSTPGTTSSSSLLKSINNIKKVNGSLDGRVSPASNKTGKSSPSKSAMDIPIPRIYFNNNNSTYNNTNSNSNSSSSSNKGNKKTTKDVNMLVAGISGTRESTSPTFKPKGKLNSNPKSKPRPNSKVSTSAQFGKLASPNLAKSASPDIGDSKMVAFQKKNAKRKRTPSITTPSPSTQAPTSAPTSIKKE